MNGLNIVVGVMWHRCASEKLRHATRIRSRRVYHVTLNSFLWCAVVFVQEARHIPLAARSLAAGFSNRISGPFPQDTHTMYCECSTDRFSSARPCRIWEVYWMEDICLDSGPKSRDLILDTICYLLRESRGPSLKICAHGAWDTALLR